MPNTDNLPTADELVGLLGGETDGDKTVRNASVGGVTCHLFKSDWGTWRVVPQEKGRSRRELQTFLNVYLDLPDKIPTAANDNEPVDVWERSAHPKLPPDLLPDVISSFADIQADTMGCDSGGLAMAALTTCAAAIPDSIVIQPKEHDPAWTESGRMWTAVVGLPSTMKTPLINAATRPLKRIDKDMYHTFDNARQAYEKLSKDERKETEAPKHTRLQINDTTIEAAQEVLKDSPEGVLLIQDELSGWFGSMDKYSGGGRGAQKDRAFWLQSFNGGAYTVNRVGRGSSFIPNLSVSLLGGIQPELIRAIAKDAHDDGLLQRLFPIVLRPGKPGKDVPQPNVTGEYDQLVERLHGLKKPLRGGMQEVPLRFSPEAQAIWQEVTARNYELSNNWESVNVKLAAHIGKYNGMFARLCLVWHCIESSGDRPASQVPEAVAARVRDFLYDYLYPHAVAFYRDVVGISDRQNLVLATAGWILTHRPATVTVRNVRRGDRIMRAMDNDEAEAVLQHLDAFGWLEPVQAILRRDSKEWTVRPAVYEVFAERAEAESDRRASIRETIASTARLQAA